mmetsp:Transcript_160104/g.509709  ORF Transcript_160104/g.509709 Transcript_160104/m.509709 type:complete len:777 (-) Transcript_160104:74-2404(-)|eukprot:CAMPEP_0203862188 /NCGR_PEP_ID=MMETSP0359-20131031/13443_1 /ASSEMBLY_ACC=CAM_ASM_000338 /TAXON_ID=268821 /ORGANISM="Scrippsiella Hangoei, Strain SHTV-5" /LENGTH=776 /DNA_ID=CAMNT_0050779545 /DNA_START=98 /DNA_END=2428 /DNA_ORIENTATION=-
MAARLGPPARVLASRLLSPSRSAVVARARGAGGPQRGAVRGNASQPASSAQGGGGASGSVDVPKGTPGGGLGSAAIAAGVVVAGGGVAIAGVLYSRSGQQTQGDEKAVTTPASQAASTAAPPKSAEDLAKEAAMAKEASDREARKQALMTSLGAALVAAKASEKRPETTEELRVALRAAEAEAAAPPSDARIADARAVLKLMDGAGALRSTIDLSLKELKSAVFDDQLVAGRMALKELGEAEAELRSLGQEKALAILKIKLDIDQAKAQLADLEAVVQGSRSLEVGRSQLQESMAAKDTKAMRKAIQSVARATMSLQDLHQEIPSDGGLVTVGVQRLHEFEREEQAAARRAAALVRLEGAVASRSPSLCAEALLEAREAAVGPCPTAQLAAILADPQGLCQALASEGAERLTELRRAHGVDVRDFEQAAAISAAGMDEAALREHVVELAGAILRNHSLHSRVLEQEMPGVQATLERTSMARMEAALAKFNKEHDAMESAQRTALEDAYRAKARQSEGEIQAASAAEAEVRRKAQHQEAMQAIGDKVVMEREAIDQRLAGVQTPVVALSELAKSGQSLQQRSLASQKLASALVALQAALGEGRPSEDKLLALREVDGQDVAPFLQRVLAKLPQETVERSSGAVPTEPELRHSFQVQLHTFKAAALEPPAEGLAGRLLSGLAGGLLARLYALRAPEGVPLVPGTPSEDARCNLNALSAATPLVQAGDLRGAVAALEVLTGSCRDRTSAWIQEARHALLLQQAMRAVQAKAHCLNAVLV